MFGSHGRCRISLCVVPIRDPQCAQTVGCGRARHFVLRLRLRTHVHDALVEIMRPDSHHKDVGDMGFLSEFEVLSRNGGDIVAVADAIGYTTGTCVAQVPQTQLRFRVQT